jgi:transposase
MRELVQLIDKNLDYVSSKIIDDTIYVEVKSNRLEVVCPICGKKSNRCHSNYDKTFSDLPIQGKKVIILLKNRKMFCDNNKCVRTTFAETFEALPHKAKKTKRLRDEIINVSSTNSSVMASKMLEQSGITVKKSSICNYLKKTKNLSINHK